MYTKRFLLYLQVLCILSILNDTIGARVSEEISPDIYCVSSITGYDLPTGEYPTDYIYVPSSGMQCGEELEEIFPNITIINCQSEYVQSFEWKHKDSDGVVLAESAMDIPQATYNDDNILKIQGSTHMRIRNDLHTRDILLQIFEGDVGDFFETLEKN